MEDPHEEAVEASDSEPGRADSVVVMEQAGVIVLGGPSALVAELIAADPVLREAAPLPLAGGAASGAMTSLAGLMGSPDAKQVVFQLDDKGMEMYQRGTLVSKGEGWTRTFGKAADGTFSGHGAIKPLMLAPQQILTAQLAITTVALTAAIREVQEAVERVERKVDVLKDLVEADRLGAILGAHRSLHRRAEQLDFNGAISDTDWSAIDGLGVEIEQQIESLRSFVRKRLQAAHDEGMRIADRRDAISYVEELAETLKLLVVAQDSLFLFQQLRLVRIRDREPHLLDAAITEANELLAAQKREDLELLAAVRAIVSGRVEVKALEIHRFMSARGVIATASTVDESLAAFSTQRTLSYERIDIPPVPGVADAMGELRGRGASLAGDAKQLTSNLVGRVRGSGDPELPAEAKGEDATEDPSGVAPAPSEDDQPAGSPVAAVGKSLRSVGRGATSRLRGRRAIEAPEESDGGSPPAPF